MNNADIVIVNWNSGKLLVTVLKRLVNQFTPPSQIWLLDNASSDGSAGGIQSWQQVRFIQESNNLGFSKGNNIALLHSDSEFVGLLNPDAFPEPDWLEKLLQAAADYPDAAAFGSRQLCHHDPSLLDGIGDTYHLSGLVWRDRHAVPQTSADLTPHEIFSPCAAAALYRRSALEEIGFFDEDYFCYVEDVDLGFRLRLAGYKAMYVPDAVVHHVGSATTGGQQSDFSVYHGHRNLVWTYVKNMPGILFWALLPLHLALNVGSILWFTARGQGKVILKAKWDAIKGLPNMWRKRRQIQKNRKASIADIWRVLDKRVIPGNLMARFRKLPP
ncbi:glycosyltransferase family 2 protein [Candidatus Thiothrix sp. Deng01]|uniref:Glycosyltransferase family 2 protein n=1 Tax=Candidatus Thiothrix phosphatis TaxID=3112415 RepID=A0ABU6D432_9GAMM|nr:glycosyltransferase family 2 protein [Candidatus Thiothrix sp. Deng01]MEB4593074.1 glycosyltransferase family 2 protein [Candidatus Thiothrix sp. Deng01]